MAEGGDITFENPAYDPYDDPYNDDDRFDETTPFIQQTSTPHSYGGEHIEMQTRHHETSGLPQKSYVETSFGGPKTSETAWAAAKDLFPNMSSSELEVSNNTKGKLQVKMFGAGKKLYSLMTTDRSTGRQAINKSLPKEIKTALGQSKYERVQQLTSDMRKLLKEKETLASPSEIDKKNLDMIEKTLKDTQNELEKEEYEDLPDHEKIDKLRGKIRVLEGDRTKAKAQLKASILAEKDETALREEIGALEDVEDEGLRQLEKTNKNNYLKTIKEWKTAVIWQKNQDFDEYLQIPDSDTEAKEAKGKILFMLDERLKQLDGEEKKIESELAQQQTISDEKIKKLKLTKEVLIKENEKSKKIVNDKDTDPEERTKEQKKIASRQRVIEQIDLRLEENDALSESESLREKVKQVFKKYGVTLAGIFVAAGVTISAVIGVITKALKDMGKQIANGLKTLGQKAASALPGLIGAVMSFLFKTAGQVVGFLAEHTWLLILAVVVFLIEKVIKKRQR